VPEKLLEWMLKEAQKVSSIIKDPPANIRNISEYTKKAHCWETGVSGRVGIPNERLLDFGISIGDYQDKTLSGKREDRQNKEVDFDIGLLARPLST
jgi:hypothetical protein